MSLPRLTPRLVIRAERAGKAAGWYKLCREGYTPAEIAINTDGCIYATDVALRARTHAETCNLPVPATCARKREARNKPKHIEDWRATFRATVMRTGMSLNLTQPMLEMLCAIADKVLWDRKPGEHGRTDTFIATAASLEKRGLVKWYGPNGRNPWRLTTAGEIVVSLLKEAHVFREADEAIRQRLGRRL